MSEFDTYPSITSLDEDIIIAMFNAQLIATSVACQHIASRGLSDDDTDYLPAALDLTATLMHAYYDGHDFTLDQLRQHIACIPLDDISPELIHMLFDDESHLKAYSDRDITNPEDDLR